MTFTIRGDLAQLPISTCGHHGPETAFLEMKQCVDALSSDRLWCNTAGIRSFEPWVPPLRLLLPPFAASTIRCWEKGWLVGAVGIENSPTPIKPCKQWCCLPRQPLQTLQAFVA